MKYIKAFLRILTWRIWRKEIEELIELRKSKRHDKWLEGRLAEADREAEERWNQVIKLQELCHKMRYSFRQMKGRDVRSRIINWPHIP